jgi:predicted TIM-barrel fold metal-dependent hydrolase
MKHADRIDVHQHVVPPFWAVGLPEHGGDAADWHSSAWTPQGAIDVMDSLQIATGILSLPAPSVTGWRGSERRHIARRVNEYTAGLVAERPQRFGNFATLPLPDIDSALVEVEYAFRTLHVDGVAVLSNYGGQYLGEPMFDALWAALNQHDAVVFVHSDKPFEMARTAVQMVLNGVLDRYPRLRIVLSHAGGLSPFAASLFAQPKTALRTEAADTASLLASFQRFYFDLAPFSGPTALSGLATLALPERMLFGTDFPSAPPSVSAAFAAKLDAYAWLETDELAAVNRANASSLFPRLARRACAPSRKLESADRHAAVHHQHLPHDIARFG